MKYNWDYVKKTTLWQYEELLKKFNKLLNYPIIRQVYNHSMPQAEDFAVRLFAENDIAAGKFPAPVIATLKRMHEVGIRDWADLLEKVATRESFTAFIEKNHLAFEEAIDLLQYLFRFGFPFYTATRELLDHDDSQEMEYYTVLKQHGLMCSFDLLEHGNSKEKRKALARKTELPLDFVTTLVQRADIARLPYVRRKTILPVCGAGYDTLAKIASAELPTMESDMEKYFRREQGKAWDDFKSVIVLRGLITGAKALPKILIS